MAAPAMVVIEVGCEDAAEVTLVQDDDVVEALGADAADHPLDVGRLPRAPRRGKHLFNAHRCHSLAKISTVHAIAIAQQVARRRLPWERLDDLLCRPRGRRMRSDVEVSHAAPVVGENDQHEQDLKAYRGDGEEVDRNEVRGVSGEERPPGR